MGKTPAPCHYSLPSTEYVGAGRIPHLAQVLVFWVSWVKTPPRPGPEGPGLFAALDLSHAPVTSP